MRPPIEGYVSLDVYTDDMDYERRLTRAWKHAAEMRLALNRTLRRILWVVCGVASALAIALAWALLK